LSGRKTDIALVLVDFDDTLVDTAPRFRQARRTLFALLAEAGFPEEEALRIHHEEVDPEMLERFGLGPRRLEPAFCETYHRLCARAGVRPDPAVREQCAAIARSVLGAAPPFDGAIEALARLAARFPTVIYTQAGDPEYQFRCIQEVGVTRVLPPDRIRICWRKTPEEFLATIHRYGVRDPRQAWMVGNSIRSDINPALTVGARAILIESREPWEHDLVEPVSNDYVQAGSFAEAVAYLLGRHGAGRARAPRGAACR